jgi:hypothetical protein
VEPLTAADGTDKKRSGTTRTEVEIVRVIDTPEATHIRYRVRR